MQHDTGLLQADRQARRLDRAQNDAFEEMRVVSPHFAKLFQQSALRSLRPEGLIEES